MIATSVLGVPITAELARACRAVLLGAKPGRCMGALVDAAELHGTPIRLVARCALGSPCARCTGAIEDRGVLAPEGWICEPCAGIERRRGARRRGSEPKPRRGRCR